MFVIYFSESEEEVVACITNENDFCVELIGSHRVGVAVGDFMEEFEDF